MNEPNNTEKCVLLVEDDPSDLTLFQDALRESPYKLRICSVKNGIEALAFLFRQGDFKASPKPHLVFLDLNLPQKDGFEVLKTAKEAPDLAEIPIIIFSTSSNERDIAKAYRLHANCFITKPSDLDGFYATISSLISFWFGTAKLPPE